MNYLSQSDMWRYELVAKLRERGNKDTSSKTQSRVLGHFRQVFPLNVFPDELIIEKLRILHIHRFGPWTTEIISIMGTDIACVNSATGMFFGHIHIKSLTGGPEILVENLTRKDVIIARALTEGIALSSREDLTIEHTQDLAQEKNSFLEDGMVQKE